MSLLTAEQVAERLQTSVRHVEYLRAHGKIHATKVGRLIRFEEQEVERFIAAGREVAR